jgi:hypothetical protein
VNRANLITGILLVLILGLSLLFYYLTYGNKQIEIWDLIPNQVVAVYEPGECTDCIVQLKESKFWKFLNQLLIQEHDADSIEKIFNQLHTSENKPLITIQVTQSNNFDLVYYLQSDVARKFELELAKWKGGKLKIGQREFNGVQINEVTLNKRVFSWISVNKFWIGSFAPLLLEDVIRTYKSNGKEGFNVEIEDVLALPRIKNDAGNLYLNLRTINTLLSLFIDGNHKLPILGKAALLDIKAGEGIVTMNGFSVLQNEDTELLSYFNSQDPVPFGLKNYISNRSISVVNYGISNGELLLRSITSVNKNKSIISNELLSTEIIRKLFSSLGKEIAICSFESRGSNLSRVLLIETSDIDIWKNTFNKLSNTIQQGDTVYYEKYSSYEIRQIEVNNLPELLFKPLVNGFAQTYYTTYDKILMISDRPEELRRVLDDIEWEEVWGKSIAFNQFLESTLLESNVSVYVNGPRALSVIDSRLNPKWKRASQSFDKSIQAALGFSAYQFSHLNENYYTNITWSFTSGGVKEDVHSINKIAMNIDQPIATRPFVVRNHTTKKDDIIVQDSLFTIHYFSADGKHQWRKNVSGAIMGEVYQVDYLNNNKLQLFFVTNGKLHVIDRLGNYVSPFPVSIAQQSIEYVSLLDYDNSKKYRYLLADKAGKLWLMDKEGKLLDGWRPLNLESSLVLPASHHRIRGKDFILSIRKDGRVYLLNRRGETIPAFPLNLEIRVDGSYFLEMGTSLSDTYFTVVSKDGIKIKFTVEGKIISRESLVKLSLDDQFSLITDRNLTSYFIKQQNSRRLTLLDERGKTVLMNEYVGSSSVNVQFYDFGANRSYILISDLDQQLCYAYTGQGELIRTVPFEASGSSLILDGDRVIIATVDGSSLTLQPLVN